MQSLIEKANNGGHFEIANSKQNWRNDWYTPIHSTPATTTGSGNNDDTQFGDGNSVEKYPFSYKAWIKTEECTWRKLLEANDSTDLLDVTTYSLENGTDEGVSGDQISGNRPANGDSLTVEDIRGAVGGVDGISGFSSSDAQAKKDQEPQQELPPVDSNKNQNEKQDQLQDQPQDQQPQDQQPQDQPQQQLQQQPQEHPEKTQEQSQEYLQNRAENDNQVNSQDQDVDMDKA